MRIRGTKPEFWKSKRIASVSWDARLVLKGLESYVDDNGVGIDDIELIVTDVFPRDMFANPRETVARVTEAISELFRAGLVHRYDANGEHLLFVSFWESVQRIDKPTAGRLPRPDGSMCYKDSYIREPLARTPETLAPVTGEQGNRGTGEQGGGGAKRPAPRATGNGQTGTRIPADFKTTPHMIAWALENTPNVNHQAATQKFKAHYRSAAGPGQFKTDWTAAWEAWMLGDQERATTQPQQFKTAAERKLDTGRANHALFAAMDAENQAKELTA